MTRQQYEIVRLVDAGHADSVTRWLLEEWPEPALSFEDRRVRLLEVRDCPETLIAFSAGAPCGVVAFVRFRRDGDEHASLFIDALYVRSTARGRGVGSALLDAGVAAAAAFDDQLFVYTSVAPWYQRRGWTVVDATRAPTHFVLKRRCR